MKNIFYVVSDRPGYVVIDARNGEVLTRSYSLQRSAMKAADKILEMRAVIREAAIYMDGWAL